MQIIPLGAWCRTAYQVNFFKKSNNIDVISFPFDWTITPFSSLKKILSPNFNLEKILNYGEVNKFGSVTCGETGLIFHHALPPKLVNQFLERESMLQARNLDLPSSFFELDSVKNAIGRFSHTYKNIDKFRYSDGLEKILFVRWQRSGHPDTQLNTAFFGENLDSLGEVLSGYLGHSNFSILMIQSQNIMSDVLPHEKIISYVRGEYGVNAIIPERRGFDGDGTKNFRGETLSWQAVLEKIVKEENL